MGRGRIRAEESGKASLPVASLMLLAGILLLIMTIIENIGGEAIGGIIAGILAIIVVNISQKFRTFQIRFIKLTESLTAENMRQFTAIRTEHGHCCFRMVIRPRKGLTLEYCNFAFFDRGKLPWLVGKRRNTNDAIVYKMRRLKILTREFQDDFLEFSDAGSYLILTPLSLAKDTPAYIELYVEISEALELWEGVFSIRLDYNRDGNPEKQNVRTKFFVRPMKSNRPFRAIGNKVLVCEPTQAEPNTGGYQI